MRDEYAAYDKVIATQIGRIPAGCLAHARRKFDELLRDGGKSAVADEALQRIAQIYRLERELAVRESAASSVLETNSKTGRLAMRYATISPLYRSMQADR